MRWDVMRDVDESGASATFPYLRGLRDGDVATSRIKQARSFFYGRKRVDLADMWLRLACFSQSAACCSHTATQPQGAAVRFEHAFTWASSQLASAAIC